MMTPVYCFLMLASFVRFEFTKAPTLPQDREDTCHMALSHVDPLRVPSLTLTQKTLATDLANQRP